MWEAYIELIYNWKNKGNKTFSGSNFAGLFDKYIYDILSVRTKLRAILLIHAENIFFFGNSEKGRMTTSNDNNNKNFTICYWMLTFMLPKKDFGITAKRPAKQRKL